MKLILKLALISAISSTICPGYSQAAGTTIPESGVPSTQTLDSASMPTGTETISKNTTTTPVRITIKQIVKNNFPKFYELHDKDHKTAYQAPIGTELEVRSVAGDKLDVVVRKVGTNTGLKDPTTPPVELDTEYFVSSLSSHDIVQDSLISGYLVVPFKYHFNDHSISTSSTTIGYYIGWEYDTPTLNKISLPTKTDFIMSFGVTPISVQTQTGTQNTNTNLLGLTLALGAGFSLADQIKLLAICGKDWARGYVYNATTWCMAGIGYSLK